MRRSISALTEKEFDLIVVGGGIFGVCAVWDAVLRGLSVALVERRDFSHATSANHLKVVHGGIRYLQHADVYRVRESCKERSALLRIAPHLIHPIPFVMPTYGHGLEGKEILGAGVLLYDIITNTRNRGIADPARRIPWGRILSRDQCLKLFPDLNNKKLSGASIFYDGQFYNPTRLAISFLRSSANAGAVVVNYVEVTKFLHKNKRVFGVKARDVLSDERFEIKGKVVLNTTGPWASDLLEFGAGIRLNPRPSFSRDLGFVVSRRLIDKYALACKIKTRDPDAILSRKGRHIFLVPWRDCTLIGVWHIVHEKDTDEISVTEKELQTFIDEINEACPFVRLGLEDISMINTGLTLFGENEPGSKDLRFGKRSMLIDHTKKERMDGLVTLIGVRATTARGMAEKAVDMILRKLGRGFLRSSTSETPIYGGKIDSLKDLLEDAMGRYKHRLDEEVVRALIYNYGSQYDEVLKYMDENENLGETVGNSTIIKAEIIHAIREEMPQKLEDIVFRRTDLGTAGYPGENALLECAYLTGKELEWDEKKRGKELQEVRRIFSRKICC
ncbi:MAG: glycerol-3-phosphate dehydrogenase/oxidase [Desulfobacterales bacterium]|nr:glycerol-3-phosphate dehydrogenase/oxidase [Desulfobacterales bacterium]MDP6806652.1 glycerol-3-phosphate dehydrogenase/oxidase [Desulfobacterales bacterium]|tara:strand:+ start:5262 stop:6941 length:1680 start_codon:yes stop_codon:yes gene_type:complete